MASSQSPSDVETAPLLPEEIRRIHRDSTGISPIIHETDSAITLRTPVHYYSINNGPQSSNHDERTSATINRYKYYGKLASRSTGSLLMPNHIVPVEYFLVIPVKPGVGTQSSIVTIFSIWNTMMGTSILSMPWALEKAGFGLGIGLMALMAGLTLYTAYRVMKSPQDTDNMIAMCDFSDVCRYYLGKWGACLSTVFSLATLLGASIVYWVLMSNFLFNSVRFIYDEARHEFNSSTSVINNLTHHNDVICPSIKPHHENDSHNGDSFLYNIWPDVPEKGYLSRNTQLYSGLQDHGDLNQNKNSSTTSFVEKIWSETYTVPFFLILLLGPLINFKSPTFFTKFNALGTLSVLYILVFVSVKAKLWGFNVDFKDVSSVHYISQYHLTFPALTGTLSLAYFIHNCILSIVQNQKHPENNGRDLSIAYVLVAFTYIFVGAIFYTTFPLSKNCIEDNLLNNFSRSDTMAFVARIFLLFQMVTVFPLLTYIFRIQILNALFGSIYPSFKHVVAVNMGMIAVCLLFAIFLPKIGTIIRFSGAFCGLAYIFTLPCLVYMLALKRGNMLTGPVIFFHVVIIFIGVANFVGQFAIIGLK